MAAAAAHASPVRSKAADQLEFGVQMALKGSWREAAFRFEKAIKADPDNAFAHNNLGVALESVGEFEKAAAAYERALQLDPRNEKIRENRERLQAYVASRAAHAKPPAPAASPAAPSPKPGSAAPGPEAPAPGSGGGGRRP